MKLQMPVNAAMTVSLINIHILFRSDCERFLPMTSASAGSLSLSSSSVNCDNHIFDTSLVETEEANGPISGPELETSGAAAANSPQPPFPSSHDLLDIIVISPNDDDDDDDDDDEGEEEDDNDDDDDDDEDKLEKRRIGGDWRRRRRSRQKRKRVDEKIVKRDVDVAVEDVAEDMFQRQNGFLPRSRLIAKRAKAKITGNPTLIKILSKSSTTTSRLTSTSTSTPKPSTSIVESTAPVVTVSRKEPSPTQMVRLIAMGFTASLACPFFPRSFHFL